MARYIDAEELKQQVEKNIVNNNAHRFAFVDTDFLSTIDDMDTADVEEVRHGEWIADGCMYKCSRCGNMESYYTDSYCRVCGAKMDGAK